MKVKGDSCLSSEQQLSLSQLKKRVEAVHGPEEAEDEYRLIRFLKARHFDVDKTEIMLNNHFEWRQQFKIEEVHNYQPSEVCVKYFPRSRRFYDKDGDIVLVVPFGVLDLKGLVKSAKKSDILQTAFRDLESDVKHMETMCKNSDKVHEQWSYIIDLEHFTFATATYKEGIDVILSFLKYYEANYPETLKRCFIVRASIYFFVIYSIIKPLLSEETVNKVKIFAKDGFQDELLKYIDADQLPAFLGGNVTDPDGNPRCLTLIKCGTKIPEKYYANNSKRRLAGQPDVKRFDISRLSKSVIEIEVTEPESFIEWQFETANHNIGFGLKYKSDKSVKEFADLIKVQKVDTQMFSEEGLYQCHESGIYILVFNNEYSWLRSKELYCKVSLILPNGEKRCVTN